MKCIVRTHFGSAPFLMLYLQHVYVLPFTSPSHDTHRAMLSACGKCPSVSISHRNTPSYKRMENPPRHLGQHISKNSSFKKLLFFPRVFSSQYICIEGNSNVHATRCPKLLSATVGWHQQHSLLSQWKSLQTPPNTSTPGSRAAQIGF